MADWTTAPEPVSLETEASLPLWPYERANSSAPLVTEAGEPSALYAVSAAIVAAAPEASYLVVDTDVLRPRASYAVAAGDEARLVLAVPAQEPPAG
jgi:hypothetical protein